MGNATAGPSLTPEQIALRLMRILVFDLRLKPDDEMPDQSVRRVYEALGGKPDEIAVGCASLTKSGGSRTSGAPTVSTSRQSGATKDVLGPRQ